MKKPVVLIGVGEMGGVFARGLLRLGHPIFPLTRTMDMDKAAKEIAEPEAVIVAVAENDIQTVLGNMPEVWRDRLVLFAPSTDRRNTCLKFTHTHVKSFGRCFIS